MRKEVIKCDGMDTQHTRVSKKFARRAWVLGYTVVIAPCNANMYFTSWILWLYINNRQTRYDNKSFDTVVNEFEYYNCNNELGKYAKYFVQTNQIEKIKKGVQV